VGVPPNVRDCLWQVQPARHYVEDKKLKKFLKTSDWNGGKNIAVPESPDKSATDEHLEEMAEIFVQSNGVQEKIDTIIELFELMRATAEERHANLTEQVRVRGKEIRYGNVCVLVHNATGKLLTVTKQRAFDGTSKRVSLDPHGSNNSAFLIRPAFKTYSDGSIISSGDLVTFTTKKTMSGSQYTLHMGDSAENAAEININRQLMIDHDYIEDGRELNACVVNIHGGSVTLFRMLLMRSSEVEESKVAIRGEDVVTFYNKQAGAYLHYDPKIASEPFFYESSRVSDKGRKKCQWMWKIESEQLYCGGEQVSADEDTKKKYRIKH